MLTPVTGVCPPVGSLRQELVIFFEGIIPAVEKVLHIVGYHTKNRLCGNRSYGHRTAQYYRQQPSSHQGCDLNS